LTRTDQSQQNCVPQAEKDKLRKELTSLSQDRNQLQQTVASLQVERSQTKRSVEQLKQGLQQLLSQRIRSPTLSPAQHRVSLRPTSTRRPFPCHSAGKTRL